MPVPNRVLALLLPLVTGLVLTQSVSGATPELKVGDLPPPTLNWRYKLSDYQGKIVIVSFWASWCAPCRKEITVLAEIQKQATRDKLVVLSVNWREDAQRFRETERELRGRGRDLTLISDEGGDIGKKYGVTAIPHMVIIGRDGRIAAIHVGYDVSEIPELVDEINKLASARP
jgi:thiol-disulfide isomerase/thioredoxin